MASLTDTSPIAALLKEVGTSALLAQWIEAVGDIIKTGQRGYDDCYVKLQNNLVAARDVYERRYEDDSDSPAAGDLD